MKRFISLFIILSLSVILLSLYASENSKNIRESQQYLKLAKEELEKGNFGKAGIYLDMSLKLNPKNKEVKALYLKIKNKERKSAKLKTPVKKLKTLVKKIKIPVKEVKEILVEKEKVPVNRFEEHIVKVPEYPRREKIEYSLPAERKFTPRGPKATILWEDFNSGWGLYGEYPPPGWTIIDNGDELPPIWNENDWYRYYYDAVQDSVARVYWSPSENQEEWLITPTLDIPAETCSLKFWHYYWDCDLTDSAYVLGSTDNGSSWTETIALFNSDHFGSDTAFDITSWASGEPQVKIAFLYYGDYDWYWMVDNCSVATYVTYTYDVGVTAILQPPDSVPQGRLTWIPKAVIKNYGTTDVKDFDVICTFQSNNMYVDTVTIGTKLNPGDTAHISFTSWNPQVMGMDTMTVYHNLATDEDRSNDTLANPVKIVRSYFTGGPDVFSYRWIDSDTTDGPTYAWIAENGGTAIGFSSADESIKVALPFSFMFYENVYDSIFICSNGYVSFGTGDDAYSNVSIPSVGIPNNAIYAFWDDLNPSPTGGGEVYYKNIANGFVVIWKDVPHFTNVGAATFEIILNDNGSIVLQYQDVNFEDNLYNFGMSATVGIENADGSTGLEYEYNGSPYGNLIFDGRAIQFECVRDSYDVAVSAIPLPPDSVPQGRRTWAPRAVLTNFGTEDVINFDVICSFKSNNTYVDTFKVSSWFNSFDDLVIDFSTWDPQIIGTDTMTIYHNLGSDEDRSNDTLSKPVKIVRSYFTGGPDAYGYSWIDSDTASPLAPTYSWIGSSGSTPVTLGDDATVKVELPFPFRFYENVYDSIWICSNGFVNFGSVGYTTLSNTALPNTGTPNNAIYCFWDDLNPGVGGTVWYKTVGSTFIVCWDDVPRLGTTNGGSFQIILYDNGGIILQYADVNFGNSSYNFGRSATVGIENSGGSTGLQYMYDWDPFGNILFPQRAIDFPCDDSPSPPIIYPLWVDLDGNFPVYWTPSIDRDGIAAYQLDEVAPDTLLYDQANANGIFDLVGFKIANTRCHSPTKSYGSGNDAFRGDTMTSTSSYLGADSVSFWWWGGCETTFDKGYFDISTDNGTSWINLVECLGNDQTWTWEDVDVSSYSGYSILLRFRFESDGSVFNGGFWVDDILVNGWQWVQTFSNSITDTTYNVTGASNGWHYYYARGKDNLNNWGNWGNIEDIWIGPNDAPTITIVQPATDTFITNPTDFTIKWIDFDTEHNAIVSIYYDTDNIGYDGTLIQGNISEDDPADSVVWDMSSIYGTYYIYGKIDDGINAPVYSYSNGVVTHLDLPAPPADGLAVSNKWLYFIVDPSETGYFLQDRSASNVLIYTVLGDTAVTSDDGVKLLFGSTTPQSSGTTVLIDGIEYVMGDIDDGTITTPIHYISGSGPTEQQTGGNDGISYTMTFGDIEVTQDALLATGLASYGHYDLCLLRYIVVNTSNNTDHTVGIRIHFDTMLDLEDGALIRVEGYPYSEYERLYDKAGPGGIPWYYWGKDSTASHTEATTVSIGILRDYGQATCPDSVCVAYWHNVTDEEWTYPYNPANEITDSDMIMWYSPRLLVGGSRGDTMVVATYYGSGPLNEDVPTAITLTEFTAAYIPKIHKIKVLWRTESEEDNLGFNVYRAIGDGEYVKLNKDIIEGAGNSSSPREYSLTDTDIKEIGIYHYKLEQIDIDGTVHTFGPASVDVRNYIPLISSLQSIFPNPFTTHSTSIPFVVGLQDGGKDMTIKIYNVSGRLVKTLVNGKLDPGYYTEKWKATNNEGRKVSSGVYYTVLKTRETTKIKKMVLIK